MSSTLREFVFLVLIGVAAYLLSWASVAAGFAGIVVLGVLYYIGDVHDMPVHKSAVEFTPVFAFYGLGFAAWAVNNGFEVIGLAWVGFGFVGLVIRILYNRFGLFPDAQSAGDYT